ncbi:MAG: hypothetical protein RIC30_10895 [Marinoscillum sp.]|uniref:hypothetical protein n=1 Tax=Marinoscillum sp. TaxID=2024838 RepID=UPI00330311BA
MRKTVLHSDEVSRLKAEIEQKLGWGPGLDWHSSVFSELSEKVFEACQVMLSATTLKRFWGVVNHDSVPSISTLDTLSQFCGYENWRDFKQNSSRKIKKQSHFPKKSLYVTAGFLLALLTVVLIGNKRPGAEELPEGITFSSRTLARTYPNSVVFDLDLQGVQSDHIHIQQYWDPTRTISISDDQQQATGIYYFPGYFRAKLLIDDEVVASHDLFLKSNGWIGTVEYTPVPKYFRLGMSDQKELFYPEEIGTEVKGSKDPLMTVYHFVDDLGEVSGDHFTLKATLRNTYDDQWAVCQSVGVYVLGTKGAMIIPFSRVGCSSDNNLMLNDVFLSGKANDLSAFGVDLSDFTEVAIEVEDRNVVVSVGGEVVYQSAYQKTMGRLVGLRFKFLGLGEVATYSLTSDGKDVTLVGLWE